MRGSGTKNFTFEKLLNATSETLQHHALTVEYTSNPAWYAVQALALFNGIPNESAEQTWNRYYANALPARWCNRLPVSKRYLKNGKQTLQPYFRTCKRMRSLKSAFTARNAMGIAGKNRRAAKKKYCLVV